MRTSNRFPGLLTPRAEGRACSLYGVRVGVCPGAGPEAWLRCFAHPSGGGVCRGHAQFPAFAPGSSKVAVGFYGLLVSFGFRICLNCSCMQLFLVAYSFFVFCCSRRGVSRCKHCNTTAKSPRSQPVSIGTEGPGYGAERCAAGNMGWKEGFCSLVTFSQSPVFLGLGFPVSAQLCWVTSSCSTLWDTLGKLNCEH